MSACHCEQLGRPYDETPGSTCPGCGKKNPINKLLIQRSEEMTEPTTSIDDEIVALKYQIDVCNVMRKGIQDNHIAALRSALARLKAMREVQPQPGRGE
jgi:DNA repair exonuclease SbcCD ATPase subunit